MARILVTGANGWIGTALCRHLLLEGHEVVGVTRQPCELAAGAVRWHAPEDDFVGLEQSWPAGDVFDAVVHLAARVHVMREHGAQALARYETSNCMASERVARLAAARGVRRFVFVSSIKALGESDHGQALDESSPAQPEDPYGISKLHAEKALRNIGGIELTIVRSPLVYGPGVGANFRRLMSAVASGWPLPLGQAHAPRSLVSVANLSMRSLAARLTRARQGKPFMLPMGRHSRCASCLKRWGSPWAGPSGSYRYPFRSCEPLAG